MKVVAVGAGASLSLGGCREFVQGLAGEHLLQPVATTCGECPAGCGLLAHGTGARLVHLESNPALPFQPGKACPGAQVAVQKLSSPLRYTSPVRQFGDPSGNPRRLDWAEAIGAVASAFHSCQSHEIAFVLGLFPDHLNDLVQLLAQALGGSSVLRFDPLGEYEGQVTLMDATQKLFGVPRIPYFDYQHAGVIFSFGSSFEESWLGSAAEARRSGRSPREIFAAHSYLVQFDSYRSGPAAWADEWVRIKPGSQVVLAQALAAKIAGLNAGSSSLHQGTFDLELVAATTGVSAEQLLRLARLFHQAERKLAFPGSAALASIDGPAAAEAILSLNLLVENLGQPGGLFLAAEAPLYPWLTSRPSTVAEVRGLVERMLGGQIKALFVHGVDLVAALPASFGLPQALERVDQLFSFASLPDETSRLAGYILPDRLALEAWGYQRTLPALDRPAVSALQPVVRPAKNTRASADVLLAAFQLAGGSTAALPFKDELDFLQQSLFHLANKGGLYRANDAAGFWQLWQEHGGWWQTHACLIPPVQVWPVERLGAATSSSVPAASSEYPFRLLLNPQLQTSQVLETCEVLPSVDVHPASALALGLAPGASVRLVSPAGHIQAVLRTSAQLAPDALILRWSIGRQAGQVSGSPLDLLGTQENDSGSLAFTAQTVRIEPL